MNCPFSYIKSLSSKGSKRRSSVIFVVVMLEEISSGPRLVVHWGEKEFEEGTKA